MLGWLTLTFLAFGLTLNPIDIIEPTTDRSAPATVPDQPSTSPPSGSS